MTRRDAGPAPALTRGALRAATEVRLRIDPAACDGIGLCAHLASGIVELDRWGFPIVVGRGLAPREISGARQAVRACPRRALWLESRDPSAGR